MTPDLLEPLTTLASGAVSATDRDRASKALSQQLTGWGLRCLRAQFKDAVPAETLEDAAQHCLAQAATGKTRFAGTTQGEAVNWCKSVMFNQVKDVLRREKNQNVVQSTDGLDQSLEDDGAPHPESRLLERDVRGLLEMALTAVRARNGGAVPDHVQLYLARVPLR